jgi:hypothetical protein
MVHLPVVLVPLALLGLLVAVVRPAWRVALGPVVAVVAGIGFIGAIIASNSGEALEDDLAETGMTITDAIRDHGEMGERVPLIAGLFFVLVLVWVLVAAWRRRAGDERATAKLRSPKVVLAALLSLSVLAGTVATVSVIRTGHSGAESVWGDGD